MTPIDNGGDESLPGRRIPKPSAKRPASWEGDDDDDRPLRTKEARGRLDASADSDLVARAANDARVTQLLSPRQQRTAEGSMAQDVQRISPPKEPSRAFSIRDSLSHCSDYYIGDMEEGLLLRPPGQPENLAQQYSARSCRTCATLLRAFGLRLSAVEAELEKFRKKSKRVITPVSNA